MKKSLTYLSSFSLILFGAFSAQAASKYSSSLYGQFPNISGQVLFELKADRIDSDQASGTSPNNAYINIEPDFSFNFIISKFINFIKKIMLTPFFANFRK